MAFVASAMFWGSGYAADNSIYIDQTGDSGTYTITQDGSGNKVKGIGQTVGSAGTDGTTAKFSGNAQTVSITQTGANNVLSIGATTTQGGSLANYANIGVNINYQVTGDGNTGIIDINNNNRGTSIGSVVAITQAGGSASTVLKMTGSENSVNFNTRGGTGNSITATIDASNVTATVDQSGGGGNTTTLDITGDKATTLVTTVGATNTTSITQSGGAGVDGQYAKLDITGSGNTTTINQSGLYDHIADVKEVGSSNTVSITQSGGYSAGHYAKVDIGPKTGSSAGSSNTVNITQSGAVDNYTNLKVSGSSNTYNIVQKLTP